MRIFFEIYSDNFGYEGLKIPRPRFDKPRIVIQKKDCLPQKIFASLW